MNIFIPGWHNRSNIIVTVNDSNENSINNKIHNTTSITKTPTKSDEQIAKMRKSKIQVNAYSDAKPAEDILHTNKETELSDKW